jgi:large subunit ribosomal protein L31e
MAKEKAASPDRVYTIPLRKAWIGAPAGKKANMTVNGIKRFITKHTKAGDVRVSMKLNSLVWKRGINKPPAKVKVKVSIKDGVATARLPDEIVIKKKEKKPSAEPKTKMEELKQKAEQMRSKKDDKKEAKPVAKTESKKEEKKGAKSPEIPEDKQSLKNRFTGFVKEMEDDPEEKPKEQPAKKDEAKASKTATENPKKDNSSNSKQ